MSLILVDGLKDRPGTGGPKFPNGLHLPAGIGITGDGHINMAGVCTFSGNVTIGGTLTYEDVTNIDSVGVVTARSGVNVSGGEFKVGTAITVGSAGVSTFFGAVNLNKKTTVNATLEATEGLVVTAGVGTFDCDRVRIVRNAGPILELTTNTNGADSSIHLHEGAAGSTSNGGAVVYSGASNRLDICCGTTLTTPKVTVLRDAYKVGLGTVAPLTDLHIHSSTPRITMSDAGTGAHHRVNADSGAGNLGIEVDYDSKTSTPAYVVNIKGNEIFRATSAGTFGLNTTAPYAYDATSTVFEVKGSVSSAADIEVARFRGGSDANDGTAVLRLTNDNDRGLVVKGGREANAEFAEFGTSSYNGTYQRAIRLKNDGKVGVGLTNPTHKLHVYDATTPRIVVEDSTNNVQAQIGADNTVARIGTVSNHPISFRVNDTEKASLDSSGVLAINNGSGASHFQITQSSGNTVKFGITSGSNIELSGSSNNDMYFKTNNTERLRITGGGKIGIGTINPNRQFDVIDAAGGGIGVIGTNAGIFMGTHHTGGFQVNAAIARAAANNYHITGSTVGDLCFAAESEADIIIGTSVSAGAMAERMRITSAGRIGINDASPANSLDVTNLNSTNHPARFKMTGNVPSYAAIIADNDADNATRYFMSFRISNSVKGSINSSNGTNTTYATSSDYRLKENISDITDGIERLKQLKPRKFNWIDSDNKRMEDGFIAHEVSPLVPEAVVNEKDCAIDENGNGYQQMDYGKVTPLLAAALKEAIAEIETLKAKVAALESN